MVVQIETDDGLVEVGTDVSEHMNGWSKQIQPERIEPGEEWPDMIWLNHYFNLL